jgi:hypothetical protein
MFFSAIVPRLLVIFIDSSYFTPESGKIQVECGGIGEVENWKEEVRKIDLHQAFHCAPALLCKAFFLKNSVNKDDICHFFQSKT